MPITITHVLIANPCLTVNGNVYRIHRSLVELYYYLCILNLLRKGRAKYADRGHIGPGEVIAYV
jgi:hypothetical protein